MFGLRAVPAFAIASAASLLISIQALADSIDWQVTHPFRYFQHNSDYQIHLWAYDELGAEEKKSFPVSAMERKLNNPRWWSRSLNGHSYDSLLRELRRKEDRKTISHDPRLGWASLLRVDGASTCWDPGSQLHRDCVANTVKVTPGSTYLEPRAYFVEAWLSAGLAGETCVWTAPSKLFLSPGQPIANLDDEHRAPCDQRVSALVPAERSTEITVKRGAAETKQSIAVKNFLIVSLGDSMASGEGNPDVPVKLDERRALTPAYDDSRSISTADPMEKSNLISKLS